MLAKIQSSKITINCRNQILIDIKKFTKNRNHLFVVLAVKNSQQQQILNSINKLICKINRKEKFSTVKSRDAIKNIFMHVI